MASSRSTASRVRPTTSPTKAAQRPRSAIERGETTSEAPFADLALAVRRHGLPVALFRDLLSAFAQDVDVTRYPTFADVLDY